MNSDAIAVRRIFEVDNARNLFLNEVVRTFVPTEPFWRLLSHKNHIVLGARGSGKTALMKMLSHSHLAKFDDARAKDAVREKKFVGIYVPAKISWMGSHAARREILTSADLEAFVWKLNLATCIAFLETAESCLDEYVTDKLEERLEIEVRVCHELSRIWLNERITSIAELKDALGDLDAKKKQQLTKFRIEGKLRRGERIVGLQMHEDLFEPLRTAIDKTSRLLRLTSETSWLLCLDEMEFLSLYHHRIVNTYLREHSGNLYFKLTTMPYRHWTLDTQVSVALNEGHDFQYLYLDNHEVKTDPMRGDGEDILPLFASRIFQKRLAASGLPAGARKNLRTMLGRSRLLDPSKEEWGQGSRNFDLLKKYCNEMTVERASHLIRADMKRFRDQIGRKIQGALILRQAVELSRGRAEVGVYSGAALVARCSDGNPRTLITLLNSLMWAANMFQEPTGRLSLRPIAPAIQNRILTEYSGNVLRRIQGEEFGSELFALISKVGSYMSGRFHSQKMSTDIVTSIEVDVSAQNPASQLVRQAVGLGYLYPSVNPKDPDRLPLSQGTFHLAFVLAPHFKLMPRKGKARDIESVFRQGKGGRTESQGYLF